MAGTASAMAWHARRNSVAVVDVVRAPPSAVSSISAAPATADDRPAIPWRLAAPEGITRTAPAIQQRAAEPLEVVDRGAPARRRSGFVTTPLVRVAEPDVGWLRCQPWVAAAQLLVAVRQQSRRPPPRPPPPPRAGRPRRAGIHCLRSPRGRSRSSGTRARPPTRSPSPKRAVVEEAEEADRAARPRNRGSSRVPTLRVVDEQRVDGDQRGQRHRGPLATAFLPIA